eukprot:7280532-Prymnesium_polylepis.1
MLSLVGSYTSSSSFTYLRAGRRRSTHKVTKAGVARGPRPGSGVPSAQGRIAQGRANPCMGH